MFKLRKSLGLVMCLVVGANVLAGAGVHAQSVPTPIPAPEVVVESAARVFVAGGARSVGTTYFAFSVVKLNVPRLTPQIEEEISQIFGPYNVEIGADFRRKVIGDEPVELGEFRRASISPIGDWRYASVAETTDHQYVIADLVTGKGPYIFILTGGGPAADPLLDLTMNGLPHVRAQDPMSWRHRADIQVRGDDP